MPAFIERLWSNKNIRNVILVFLATRFLIFLVSILATQFLPVGSGYNAHLSDNSFLNAWAQYDAKAYLDIGENGYNKQYMNKGNYQWWPTYPFLIALFGQFIGYALAGFLIANIAFVIALYYLYKLIADEYNETLASHTLIFLLVFPISFFFHAIYSESVFLALMAALFYYSVKRNWCVVGIVGFFASVSRIFGVFTFLIPLYIYARDKQFNIHRVDKNFLYIWLVPLSVLLFMGYLYATTGNPLAFADHSQTSARHITFPFKAIYDDIFSIINSPSLFRAIYHPINLFVYIGFIILTFLSFKYLHPYYGIYMAYSLIIPTFSTPIEGILRYATVLFPGFMIFALLQKHKHVRIVTRLLILGAVLLMIYATASFTRGGIDFIG